MWVGKTKKAFRVVSQSGIRTRYKSRDFVREARKYATTIHSSDNLAVQFTGLIKSWLKKMVCPGLASSIDEEQLASTILLDLIRCVGKLDGDTVEHGELVRICRTITKRRVSNAVVFAQRRKLLLPTQSDPRLDLNEFHDWDKSLPPEHQVELDDFIEVFKKSLDVKNREIVELKRLGWTNEEIAVKLKVSIRTIQSRYETIEMAYDILQKKSDHPSPITHHPSPITHHPSPITRNPKPETRKIVELSSMPKEF